MKPISADQNCPCYSQQLYKDCCQPFIENKVIPPDPESVMRSRYTAFTVANINYLKETWHPDTVPELTEDEPSAWVSLEILETAFDEDDPDYGEVEFIAKLINGNKLETLHEVSAFERVDGRWLYHSGEFKNENQAIAIISMKTPCPCGSGEKFKHCHFAQK